MVQEFVEQQILTLQKGNIHRLSVGMRKTRIYQMVLNNPKVVGKGFRNGVDAHSQELVSSKKDNQTQLNISWRWACFKIVF